jgi:uncharacterized protein (TIGR02452 family)
MTYLKGLFSMLTRKEKLINVFKDTENIITKNKYVAAAANYCAENTKVYKEDDNITYTVENGIEQNVYVSKNKTFEAAMLLHKKYPGKKIAVLNFASATNPGGGVKSGSSAQEECLCRCSTLYPALNQKSVWDKYYSPNRLNGNAIHTSDCIYTPNVLVFKNDEDIPRLMPQKDWFYVDVISCAAPNLRKNPNNAFNIENSKRAIVSDTELYDIHQERATRILSVARANDVDIVVLGAFGCGAFANSPDIVAKAYADMLFEFKNQFTAIEFAVFCRDFETTNYDAFKREISKK